MTNDLPADTAREESFSEAQICTASALPIFCPVVCTFEAAVGFLGSVFQVHDARSTGREEHV